MSCSRCGTVPGEYLSEAGDTLCRGCYFAEQTQTQERRAVESQADEVGLDTDVYRSIGGNTALSEPLSPQRSMLGGVGLTMLAVALALVELVAFGGVHVKLVGAVGLAGVGFLSKGIMDCRRAG